MAKTTRRKSDSPPPQAEDPSRPDTQPAAPAGAEPAGVQDDTVPRTLIVPWLESPPRGGYSPNHIDLRLNTPHQRETLKTLFWAYCHQGVPLRRPSDVIPYLLDQIAAADGQ